MVAHQYKNGMRDAQYTEMEMEREGAREAHKCKLTAATHTHNDTMDGCRRAHRNDENEWKNVALKTRARDEYKQQQRRRRQQQQQRKKVPCHKFDVMACCKQDVFFLPNIKE